MRQRNSFLMLGAADQEGDEFVQSAFAHCEIPGGGASCRWPRIGFPNDGQPLHLPVKTGFRFSMKAVRPSR